jgi:LmbE family N-acetylglucosaminyl deacetylase
MEALVVPAALGNHVDHLTVREAAQPFTSERPAAFYEDLPYAATHATAAADLEALRAASPLKPGLCQADAAVERKHALVLGYASQIDAEAATLIINFVSRYNSGERLWANPAWSTIAEASSLSTPDQD